MKLKANLQDKKPESNPPEVVEGAPPPPYLEKPPAGFQDKPVIAQSVSVKRNRCTKKKACLVVTGVLTLIVLIAVPVVLCKTRNKNYWNWGQDEDERGEHGWQNGNHEHGWQEGNREHELRTGMVQVANNSDAFYKVPGAMDFRRGVAAIRDDKIKRCYVTMIPFHMGGLRNRHKRHGDRSSEKEWRRGNHGGHSSEEEGRPGHNRPGKEDCHFDKVKMTYIYSEGKIEERTLVLRTAALPYSEHIDRSKLGKEMLEFCQKNKIYRLEVFRGKPWDAFRKTYILRRDFAK
jgi:hypothetical protein